MTTDPKTLTIAVLTYRRPDDLAAVLPLLVEQAASVGAAFSVRVLVVDNDPEASARGAVFDFGEGVEYVHEAEPGIAAARNRALAESAGSRLLVFIDDDERPSERWLREITALVDASGVRAVVGPVVSEYQVEPDPWIVAGGFFERRRLADRTEVEVAATNNLLIDLAWVREVGLGFDPALGISGGEDTLFTRGIVAHGGRILWAARALVTDVVPAERLTRRWVLQRAFSSGNSWSSTALRSAGHGLQPRLRAALTAKGLTRVAGGVARLAFGLVGRSVRSRARGMRTLCRGAGMIAGAWGYGYLEYRRS
jgi:glycosyltransferase involved in cell wall biosynthesis